MGKKLDAQVITIYGRRGTGKTTRIRELIEKRNRVLVLSTRAEFPNQVAWPDLGATISAKQFQAAYTPKKGAVLEAGHRIGLALLENKGPLLTLVIDEAQNFMPQKGYPADLQGLVSLVQEGRHANVEIIAATQRPATVSTDLRGNAEIVYCFGLSWANDIELMASMFGREYKARIQSLEDHEFLRHERGDLTTGRNAAKF